VGARNLGECLTLQLRALQDARSATAGAHAHGAAHLRSQPMELLARRDVRAWRSCAAPARTHVAPPWR
jgi:DNA-directed RNA polymerase specialized sigma54-like protein